MSTGGREGAGVERTSHGRCVRDGIEWGKEKTIADVWAYVVFG